MKPWVIKIGGAVAENPAQLQELAQGLWLLAQEGQPWVLVHGGGKAITRHLAWLGEEPIFVEGLRKTSTEAMSLVEMTLSGLINKQLVRLLQKEQPELAHQVLGLSGVDLNIFTCQTLNPLLGRVGQVTQVQTKSLNHLLDSGYKIVLSPVSRGAEGEAFNVNADDAAGSLAAALQAERMVYISDVSGVLDAHKQVIPLLYPQLAQELTEAGVIQGGMIPKVRNCFEQIKAGIGSILIGDWPGLSTFKSFLHTGQGWGTSFTQSKPGTNLT